MSLQPEETKEVAEMFHSLIKSRIVRDDVSPEIDWRNTPGVTGEIVKWILDNSQFPRPELAVSAALSFMSVVKAHRVKSETDLRTNIYISLVSPPGSGKDWPQKAVLKLMDAVNISGLALAEPSSGAGLISMLNDSGGLGLLVWDEFGDELGKLSRSQISGYESEIFVLFKKLFSLAGTFVKSRAVKDTSAQVVVKQPCLSDLCATTPDKLFSVLNHALVEDGFVPRFLFVLPENPYVEERMVAVTPPPNELIFKIQQILRWPTNTDPTPSSNGFISRREINPRTVKFNPASRLMLNQYGAYFQDQRESLEGSVLSALYARAKEHLQKIALVVSDGQEIGIKELSWAFDFVSYAIDNFVKTFGDKVADSPREKIVQKVIICLAQGEITKRELVRKTQWLSQVQREDIISGLIEAGRVHVRTQVVEPDRVVIYYRLA